MALAGKNPVGAAGRPRKRKGQAMPGIVVGIDGSANSKRALEWAMRHAGALQVPLTVIAVHEVPKSYWGHMPVIGPPDAPVLAQLRVAAEEMTSEVASTVADAGPPSVKVRAMSGFVVQELVDASRDADLIVLGQRGGSGLGRLVMGSVSSEVVQHTVCPVVLVPHVK
jgi:nucleotide-binding universal stress UspA family protein